MKLQFGQRVDVVGEDYTAREAVEELDMPNGVPKNKWGATLRAAAMAGQLLVGGPGHGGGPPCCLLVV